MGACGITPLRKWVSQMVAMGGIVLPSSFACGRSVYKGIKLDRSAKIITTHLQGTQASPFLRVLWYWTKSLAGV